MNRPARPATRGNKRATAGLSVSSPRETRIIVHVRYRQSRSGSCRAYRQCLRRYVHQRQPAAALGRPGLFAPLPARPVRTGQRPLRAGAGQPAEWRPCRRPRRPRGRLFPRAGRTDGGQQRWQRWQQAMSAPAPGNPVSIVDRAKAPAVAAYPRPATNMALAALAGAFALGAGMARNRTKVEAPADVEPDFDAELLGVVPLPTRPRGLRPRLVGPAVAGQRGPPRDLPCAGPA